MKAIFMVALVSVVALGCGAGVGWFNGSGQTAEHGVNEARPPEKASHVQGVAARMLREVRPIVTNLATPSGAWIRLELALTISGAPNPKLDQLVAEFVSDSTDFLRTVGAQEIEGANGLRRLREDLLDRAQFRIGPEVETVLIQTLVVQ